MSWFRRGLAASLAAASLTACTVGPSPAPDVLAVDDEAPTSENKPGDEPVELPPIGEPPAQSVSWSDCRDELTDQIGKSAMSGSLNYECGSIYSTPDDANEDPEASVDLNLVRVGSDSDKAVPLVAINDIGGEPGTRFAARLAKALPSHVLSRYAIVGVDRRGTGQSQPVDCIPQLDREGLLNTDPDAEHVDKLLESVRGAGMECAVTLKSKQHLYDTATSANDLEQLREHLGVPRLHAIGRGEGSRVLTTFAANHRDRVGRMVLDGIPDPTPQIEKVQADVAASAEATWKAFVEECKADKCPLGKAPAAALQSLLERLDTRPGDTRRGPELGPGLALNAIWAGLAEPQRWPELAEAIDAARDDKPDKLAAFIAPATRVDDSSVDRQPASVDATLATTCNDVQTRLSPERLKDLTDDWAKRYPRFGGLAAQRLAWCSKWPVPSEGLPSLSTDRLPPVLAVSTAADPTVPERGTERAASQMDTTRRVSWQGAGHGGVGRSDCVDQRVAGFLAEGKVPSSDTSCPA